MILDKISNTHSKLYKLTDNLERFFGYQVMLNIVISFLQLATIAFQIFTSSLLIFLGFGMSFNINKVAASATVLMIFTMIDIGLQMTICAGVITDVRAKETLPNVLKFCFI